MSDHGICPTCGVRYCALFATTNASALAEWRSRHLARPVPLDKGGER